MAWRIALRALLFVLIIQAGLAAQPVALQQDLAGVDPVALVREAKKGQDWFSQVDSVYVKTETETFIIPPPGTTQPAQATIGAATQAGATTQPESRRRTVTTVLAFDRKRLYQSSDSMLSSTSSVRFWDGQTAGYQGRENFYELTDSLDTTARSFMTNGPWGRNGQVYWWTRDLTTQDDFIGAPERYTTAAREMFHGVDCYVLSGGRLNARVYVGVADHRYYGSTQGSSTYWFTDYNEISLDCWYPMTQGNDIYSPISRPRDGSEPTGPTYLSQGSVRRVLKIAVNEPLPEELFKLALKDGMRIHEERKGVARDYVYSPNRTADEEDEIRADVARRALFAPPPLPPGPVTLGARADPLPLNPLALSPAADFPAGAKWINGEPRKLSDLRGKVVLIVFFASWMDFSTGTWGNEPFTVDLKLLEPARSDVVVIGVHVPTKDSAKVKKSIEDHKFEFPVCIDVPVDRAPSWGTMAESYRLDQLPTVYVIDQEGKVAALGSWGEAVRRTGELLGKPLSVAPQGAKQ